LKRILLVLVIAAMVVALGALPALAQPTTLTATGVLGQPFFEGQDPEPLYPLTDEATGTTYTLISGFVDLGAFVGQRVTIEGVRVPGIDPLAYNVTSIQPAAPSGGSLPATGGPSFLLVPTIALIVGIGVLGTTALGHSRR
jgi:hypothetical protein